MANIPLAVEILLDAFSPGTPGDIMWDKYAGDKNGSPRFDHAIEERGFIEFRYPRVPIIHEGDTHINWMDPGAGLPNSASSRKRKLPMFENPRINETRSANWQESNIFMRNEPVRLYTGTGARKFDIELMYTLPHIGAFYNNYYLRSIDQDQRDEIQTAINFYRKTLELDPPTKDSKVTYPGATGFIYAQGKAVGYKEGTAVANLGNGAADGEEVANTGPRMPINTPVRLGDKNEMDGKSYFRARALDSDAHSMIAGLIDYFMNIIRSSVISTVAADADERSKFGPPLAYLKFGTVYNHVPCIVKSYKIELDPFKAGMDNASFYTRMIRVKLQLEEFRQEGGIVNSGEQGPYGWNTLFNLGGTPRGKL